MQRGKNANSAVTISSLPNIFTALTAHLPSADDNSMIGCTSHDSTDDWSQPMPISLTANAHFAARLGAFFLVHNVSFDNTTPIYLINLPRKLGLGLGLDLRMHYFSIFHGE